MPSVHSINYKFTHTKKTFILYFTPKLRIVHGAFYEPAQQRERHMSESNESEGTPVPTAPRPCGGFTLLDALQRAEAAALTPTNSLL